MKTALERVREDGKVLQKWWATQFSSGLSTWIDQTLTPRWGKMKAARVHSICRSGHDGDPERFVQKPASEMDIGAKKRVPGAPHEAKSIYDLAQALSWVAGTIENVEDRRRHIADIPKLVETI